MRVDEFDYELPEERIAQAPLADRAGSRMLRLDRATGRLDDRLFRDLPALLTPGDLLVCNETRVFPARLLGRRSGARAQPVSGRNPAARDFLQGEVEALLTAPLGDGRWSALVRPGKKIGVGERLRFFRDESPTAPHLEAEVIARGDHGERTLQFERKDDGAFLDAVERIGHVPLPPYIHRVDTEADRARYQTVFAGAERGSVAAPTAGLHFTPEVLEALREQGVEQTRITLHVGLGTFQPLHSETVEENTLHAERYAIPPSAAESIQRAKREGRRVVAVGTTVVRALEHAALQDADGRVTAQRGETAIFLYPGHRFRAVDALLTNFHLPRSSLLMLVCAFAGRETTLAAYRHAVQAAYRFYSYGDCMLIE